MTETKDPETTPVALRLPTEQLKYLRRMSHFISIERDEDLSYVDLIREAIEQVYPLPLTGMGNENQNDGSQCLQS